MESLIDFAATIPNQENEVPLVDKLKSEDSPFEIDINAQEVQEKHTLPGFLGIVKYQIADAKTLFDPKWVKKKPDGNCEDLEAFKAYLKAAAPGGHNSEILKKVLGDTYIEELCKKLTVKESDLGENQFEARVHAYIKELYNKMQTEKGQKLIIVGGHSRWFRSFAKKMEKGVSLGRWSSMFKSRIANGNVLHVVIEADVTAKKQTISIKSITEIFDNKQITELLKKQNQAKYLHEIDDYMGDGDEYYGGQNDYNSNEIGYEHINEESILTWNIFIVLSSFVVIIFSCILVSICIGFTVGYKFMWYKNQLTM